MLELALIVGVIGAILAFVVWSTRQARIDGATRVTADEQADILGKVAAAQEAEREVEAANPGRRVTDRLQSEWSRD